MNRFSRFAIPFSFALALTQPALTETLKKPDLDRLVADQRVATAPEFRAFLVESARANPKVAPSVAAYQSKAALAGDDLVNIGRLLGLYNRLRNQKAVHRDHRADGGDSHGARRQDPAAREQGHHRVRHAGRSDGQGLRRWSTATSTTAIFEVKLPGRGRDEFGILTHADVVPVVADEWVLDDGTRLDPFKVTRVGDYLYGRGTIDDKGSIAAVLYAMKAVKESGLPLDRTIRLMIETTEETGGDAMKYYREQDAAARVQHRARQQVPGRGGRKRLGRAEGLLPGASRRRHAARRSSRWRGAAAANAVPQTATATLEGRRSGRRRGQAGRRQGRLHPRSTKARAASSRSTSRKGADGVDVKVTGASAHGSRPEEGVNPLPRLALFLQESGVPLADNHYAKAVKYLNDLYGTGYLGEKMGVGYADDFMGPLTMSPNLIRERDGKLEVTANVRMPRGSTPEALNKAVTGEDQRLGRGQPGQGQDRLRAGQLDGARPEGRVAVDAAQHLRRHHRASRPSRSPPPAAPPPS